MGTRPQLTQSSTDRGTQVGLYLSFFLSINEVFVSSRRTLILIAAIGVGLFAGLALLNYVRSIEDDVYADVQPVLVLIASEDIPEGTPASLAIQMMAAQEIPLEIRPATFLPVNEADQIAGLVARGFIPKNQIIVQGLFADPAIVSARFTDQVPSGQVAMTVMVGQVAAVGGYLQPGDEVNIMVRHVGVGCAANEVEDEGEENLAGELQSNTGSDTSFGGLFDADEILEGTVWCTYSSPARYLFQRVEILAIGARQTLQPGEVGSDVITPQGGAITFMLPNEAAQILASVTPSDIYLTLVPEDYEAEVMRPLPLAILDGRGPTPAEMPGCLTPYGPDGFIEGDSVDGVADEESDTIAHFSCDQIQED
jgi:Flp pilus assembly protein CpaB